MGCSPSEVLPVMLLVWNQADLFALKVPFQLLCPLFFGCATAKSLPPQPEGDDPQEEHCEQHGSEYVYHDVIEQRVVRRTYLRK